MNLLLLDAGHAKNTAGKKAPDNSFYEWDFNNKMQYKIKKRAEEHGIHVYLSNPTPETTSDIALTTRANKVNDYWKSKGKPKALMISLHANAFQDDFNSARGTETFVANNASTNSKNFAKDVNSSIVSAIKKIDSAAKDRGVKCKDWTVIQKASMPSVLLEYAFYTNKADLNILKNHQDELVEATVKSICKYFNVVYKAPTTVPTASNKPNNTTSSNNSTNNTMYAVCVGAYKDINNAKKMQQEMINKGYKDTYLIKR